MPIPRRRYSFIVLIADVMLVVRARSAIVTFVLTATLVWLSFVWVDSFADFGLAPKSTWLIDNFGNLGRRCERKNGNVKAAPLTVWHRLSQSALLRQFEVKQVPASAAAAEAAPSKIVKQHLPCRPR